MSFEIDSIGIEYEFIVPEWIDSVLPTVLKELRKINESNDEFTITVDREYYSEQIEFKLMRNSNIQGWVEFFQNAMRDMYNIITTLHSTTRKHFVWTHIHLFLNKDWVPYTKFAQWKKVQLVKYAYLWMASYLKSLLSDSSIQLKVIKNEMIRLTTNHNILRYFDHSIWDRLKRNLEENGMNYQQFHSGTERPKYTPVLWSLANEESGKPHSLEIRCIPNSFLMLSSPETVTSYIKWVADVLNAKVTQTPEDASIDIATAHLCLIKEIRTSLKSH